MKESGENTIRTGERFNTGDMFQTEQLKSRQALRNIQPKLKVGSPGDRYEQEADSVAEKVMDLDHNLQMHPGENNLVMNRMHPLQNPPIQMKCKECEEEEMLQTKSDGNKVTSTESISEQLHSTRGTGISMSEDVNRFMSNAEQGGNTLIIIVGNQQLEDLALPRRQLFAQSSRRLFAGALRPLDNRSKHR